MQKDDNLNDKTLSDHENNHKNVAEEDDEIKKGTNSSEQDDQSEVSNLDNFKPLIPDLVLDHLLELNGIDHADLETKKTVAALAQKFITDIATSAFQFHKIHQKAAMKDKRFAKEKKLTLNVNDLQKALEEYGIDISRPSYFI